MTDEEIRIAIAEACGYVWYRTPKHPFETRRHRMIALPALHEYEGQSDVWLERADGSERICNMKFMETNGYLPDYLNDLNAMHEAEKTLVRFMDYETQLERVCKTRTVWNATARQRAEAFLSTLGKWRGV